MSLKLSLTQSNIQPLSNLLTSQHTKTLMAPIHRNDLYIRNMNE